MAVKDTISGGVQPCGGKKQRLLDALDQLHAGTAPAELHAGG